MTDSEVFENKENMPLESYSFTYSEEEYNKANQGVFKGLLMRTVVFGFVFLAITAGLIMSDLKTFFGGILVGWTLLYFVLALAGLFKSRKGWESTKERVCSSLFKYELFDTYMLLTVTRDGECVHFTKLEYDKIISKIDTGRFYLLNFANQLYLIKKQEIAENSIFHTLKPKAPEKPSATLRGLSKALMVLTIVSGVCGFICAGAQMLSLGKMEWWYLFAFGSVPLASLIFGIYMKKYGGGRGNVFAGLFVFAIVFAMFYAWGNEAPARADKYAQIEAVESYIGVDLPNPHTYDNFRGDTQGVYYVDTAMEFYDKDVNELERFILNSKDWSSILNNETNELVADVGVAEDWDFVCVYNITTDEYNKVPEVEGTYDMAAMYYDMDYNGLYVIEYEYVK